MSSPTPGYLTRRASAPPSLVLLVFLRCADLNQSQQLSHDRLAIAVPLDATVSQLQSLIEQRYQQLVTDDDDEDGGHTHRLVVRRVYKVAEFAYVVSRNEAVGEVFSNEEPVQADVSIRPHNSEKQEEAKEQEERQQDGDDIQHSHLTDGNHVPPSTPTPPDYAGSLSTPVQHATPTSHSKRATQHPQPRTLHTRNRSSGTLQQRHSRSEAKERNEREGGMAVEEVEGAKKLDRQLVQRFNTITPSVQPPARTDIQSELPKEEQPESVGEQRMQEQTADAAEMAKDIAGQRRGGSSSGGTEAMDDVDDRPLQSKGRKTATHRTVLGGEEKRSRDDGAAEGEKQLTTEKAGDDSLTTPVQPVRSSTSIVADSGTASTPLDKKKPGRKRKRADAAPAAPAASSTAIASLPTAIVSTLSSSSAALSAATSAPPSAASQGAPPLVVGPSATRCVLCGQGGGVFKLTHRSRTDAPEWCHQMCATWCDGTIFSWKDHRVYGIKEALNRARRKQLQCRLCQHPVGKTAPVQCVDDDCDEAFHITCGVAHQYQTFEAEPDAEAQARGMQEEFVAACPCHNNPKYDEKNDDDCCICLYTRPNQPEMSTRLTCMECGVRVHRTCYYNLPSDSVRGAESEAADGRIDWQRWTCMCCEYRRSGIYYFVDVSRKKRAGSTKKAVSGRPSTSSSSQATNGGSRKDKKRVEAVSLNARTAHSRRGQQEELGDEEAEAANEKRNEVDERKREGGDDNKVAAKDKPAQERVSTEVVHIDESEEEDNTNAARSSGKRRKPAEARGSGTTKKRQRVRQEVFKQTGFTNGRAPENVPLPSQIQNGQTEVESEAAHEAINGAAVVEADEEKSSSQQQLPPPRMSPVNSRAVASVHTSPPLPIAKKLDPRRTAAIRLLEEKANREKLAARTASTRPSQQERAARTVSTLQTQQQQRTSSSGLIINTIRASSLSQPTAPSGSSTPVSHHRSTLSRKEYVNTVSRYSEQTLRAVLHHHGLNYTGTREGLVARLMAATVQLPSEDERQQWQQAWATDAGEDKDKPMLRMTDREFERHRQQRQQANGVSRETNGGVHAAVAGFGPPKEVQRLRQSTELAVAVEVENMEEDEVDDMDDDEDDEKNERDGEEQQSDEEKLREAIDAIEEFDDSSEEDQVPVVRHQHGRTNGRLSATGRGNGSRGGARGGGGQGGGGTQTSGEETVRAAERSIAAVKHVNGHANGRGRGSGRGRKRGHV